MKILIFLLLISNVTLGQSFSSRVETTAASAARLAFVTDSLATALATSTQTRLNDTAAAIRTTVNIKQNNISLTTTGTSGASTFNGTVLNIPNYATGGAGLGYTLNVQALTSSPVDGQTVYFGQLPKAPITTANVSKVYIRKAGTIKAVNIYCYSGTAGTNQAWVLYIRLNNTTDTQIGSLSLATNERVWSNTNLNIAVVEGDYIEIKSVNPTWTTNPLTTIWGGYIYIE